MGALCVAWTALDRSVNSGLRKDNCVDLVDDDNNNNNNDRNTLKSNNSSSSIATDVRSPP